MTQSLQGQVALVTGGAGGYGAGIAEVLKKQGVQVYITDIDEKGVEDAAQNLSVKGITADAASPEDWDKVTHTILKDHNRLDILVNNAGGGICIAPLDEQPDDLIIKSVMVNLTGKIFGCSRAARIMKKQKSGTIINISSVCARQAWPGWSTYSAAKAGVVSLSRCLYTELREHGVRVTTVYPSWGATKFTEAAQLGPRDQETLAKCIKPTELGDLIAYISGLPAHLDIQDVTLWPMVQEVMPL